MASSYEAARVMLALVTFAAAAAAGCTSQPAPDTFTALFTSTAGDIRINVTRALAPIGVDHFFGLLTNGYYDDVGFVRIEKWVQGYNFIQWGIASDPSVAQRCDTSINDDVPCFSCDTAVVATACLRNVRGSVALAADASMLNSRSTMLYVNMQDNNFLDCQNGFVPFGVIADDASWSTLYGINTQWLEGIYLPMVYAEGSAWLRANYPGLDFTIRGTVLNTSTTATIAAAHAADDQPRLQLSPAFTAAAGASILSYAASWVGNSFGGGPDQFVAKNASWVSYCADDIDVDAGGWVFSNTGWDEGTREAGIFAPNGTVAGLMADLHGWSRSGGVAVAAGPVASNRVYVGMSQAPLSYPGPLRDYPVNGTVWYGVRTYDRSGNTVPCPNGTCHGWDSSILVVCTNCSQVGGIATSPDGSLLYVSDTFNELVRVYNLTTYEPAFAWPVPRPGKLAVEPDTGFVWVAPWTNVSGLTWPYTGSLPSDNSLLRFTASGTLLTDCVSDVVLPTDVAVDAVSQSVLVAENGPAQQVVVYALPSATSAIERSAGAACSSLNRSATIGEVGGVLAGDARGAVRPDAFSYLTGVGVDANGHVVVASVGYTQNKLCSGLDLRSLSVSPSLVTIAAQHRATAQRGAEYAPAAVQASNVSVVWNLLGLEWVDSGAAAPAWPSAPAGVEVVFTEHERFVVNYSAAQGQQWQYAGYTVDPLRFGASDARLQTSNFATASVTVRSVRSRSFLFASGMYVQGPAWYRLERDAGINDSEIAIPCGLLSKDRASAGSWPATQGAPVGSSFVWQDWSGDGVMQPDEFTSFGGLNLGGVWGTHVADDGSLWVVSEDHWMWAWQPLPSSATAASPCLLYNFSAPPMVNASDLPPLAQTERALYLPAQDVLYVTGFTPALDNPNRTWGQAGRWVQRYESFLTGYARGELMPGVGWMLPWTNQSCSGVCSVDDSKSVAAVDDLLLVVTGQSATVYVYNGTTGDVLGTMAVAAGGPAMGNYTGWVDTPFGLTVARTARGSVASNAYTAFVEEDGREKVVMYTFTV